MLTGNVAVPAPSEKRAVHTFAGLVRSLLEGLLLTKNVAVLAFSESAVEQRDDC